MSQVDHAEGYDYEQQENVYYEKLVIDQDDADIDDEDYFDNDKTMLEIETKLAAMRILQIREIALLRLSFPNDMNGSNGVMTKRMQSFYKKTREHSEKSNMYIIKKQSLFEDNVNENLSRQE